MFESCSLLIKNQKNTIESCVQPHSYKTVCRKKNVKSVLTLSGLRRTAFQPKKGPFGTISPWASEHTRAHPETVLVVWESAGRVVGDQSQSQAGQPIPYAPSHL